MPPPQAKKSLFGWACRQCTFWHDVPGTRCAMCDALRSGSAQECHDFVLGKKIPPVVEGNFVEIRSTPPEASENNGDGKQQPTRELGDTEGIRPPKIDESTGAEVNKENQPNSSRPNSTTSATGPADHDSLPITNRHGNNQPQESKQLQQQQHQQKNQKKIAPVFDSSRAKTGVEYGRGRRLSLVVERFFEGPVPVNEEAEKEWIYPVNKNFPRRDYQFEIAQTAIEYNTLVSLPTGLGKTHIAAVVMYNFWRWFAPAGKVVFCAPTVPLVRQQVEACYSITGIPASDTCVMTGKSMKPKDRRRIWEEKRVFYCTPQTIQKDLEACIKEAEETGETDRSTFASQIVCLVLDEAHRATGKYAFVKVIELLESIGAKFRIVGLSATPGTSIKSVQSVLEVLRATKVQVRTEDDESVRRYLHEKQEEVVICPKNNIQNEVERQLTNLLCPILNKLRERGVFRKDGNATITPYLIVQEQQWYNGLVRQKRVSGFAFPLYGVALKLASARNSVRQSLEVVQRQLRELQSATKHPELRKLVPSDDFQSLFALVTKSTSEDNEVDAKLVKLKEELVFHFEKKRAIGESSKAIVFVNSRDAVQVIVEYLRKFQPLILPRHFIGQSSGAKKNSSKSHGTIDNSTMNARLDGMTQKEQEQVIKQFKDGIYNVLVCTSIGEEGLDIGEVDLIVSYDIIESPTRNIQRAGRTGRKRDGRVICLVAEGEEEKKYRNRKVKEKTIQHALERSEKFTMAVHRPMLKSAPACRFQEMDILSQIHMSQVVGASRADHSKGEHQKKKGKKAKDFRLTAIEEEERALRCGDLVVMNDHVGFKTLRRAFLRSRETGKRSQSGPPPPKRSKRRKVSTGRILNILNHLEKFGPTNAAAAKNRDLAIQKVFPQHSTSWEQNEFHPGRTWTETLSKPSIGSSSAAIDRYKIDIQPIRHDVSTKLPAHTIDAIENVSSERTKSSILYVNSIQKSISGSVRVGDTNAPNNGNKEDNEELEISQMKLVGHDPSENQSFRLPTPPPSSSESSDDESEIENGEKEFESSTAPSLNNSEEITKERHMVSFDSFKSLEDDTNQNNSTEGAELDSCNVDNGRPIDDLTGTTEFSGNEEDDSRNHQDHQNEETEEAGFRLPTQDSSSSDEGGDSEDESDDGSSHDAQIALEVVVEKDKPRSQNVCLESQHEASLSDDDDDRPLFALKEDADNDREKSETAEASQGPVELNVAGSTIDHSKKVIFDAFEDPMVQRTPKDEEQQEPVEGEKVMSLSTHDSQDICANYRVRDSKCRPRIESFDSDEDSRNVSSGLDKLNASDIQFSSSQELKALSCAVNTPKRPFTNDELSALEDTPADPSEDVPDYKKSDFNRDQILCRSEALVDTPCSINLEDAVCEICGAGDSEDDFDPILLCDQCNRCVHQHCYSSDIDWTTENEFKCDMCTHVSSSTETKCTYCSKKTGLLRRMQDLKWCHPLCHITHDLPPSTESCKFCSGSGAIKCTECSQSCCAKCVLGKYAGWTIVHVQTTSNDLGMPESTIYCPQHSVSSEVACKGIRIIRPPQTIIEQKKSSRSDKNERKPALPKKLVKKSSSGNEKSDTTITTSTAASIAVDNDATLSKKDRREEFQKRRGCVASIYFLEEAEADSEDEIHRDDEEERLCRQMEDDEALSQDSFINDSENLTQHSSQDDLDAADPHARHHRFDVQRERDNLFATPLLNRRLRSGEERLSLPTSERGLGQMHFVRSLMAHVRDGGDVNEVEATYQRLAENGTQWSPSASSQTDNVQSSTQHSIHENPTSSIHPSASAGGRPPLPARDSSRPISSSALTEEQRMRMEANRQEALRRKAAAERSKKQEKQNKKTVE